MPPKPALLVLGLLACLLLSGLAVVLLRQRSGRSWGEVLEAMQAPFALAVRT